MAMPSALGRLQLPRPKASQSGRVSAVVHLRMKLPGTRQIRKKNVVARESLDGQAFKTDAKNGHMESLSDLRSVAAPLINSLRPRLKR